MNKQGNTYTFLYSVVLVVVVAALLSIVSLSLQPRQNENRQNEKRQNILSAIHISSTAANSAELFDKYIKEQFIINSKGDRIEGKAFDVNIEKQYNLPVEKRELPVFVANVDGATKYILPIYGAGLWGPIWGYISLDDNKDTVYGTFFDHQGETPGLGAEITTPEFNKKFRNKQIFSGNQLVGILVVKGGNASGANEVDAISGGTITSKGVETMIKNYFARRAQLKKERALAREAALARKREEMAKTEEPEDLQEKEEDIDTEEKEKLDIETVPPVEDELFPRHEFDTTDPDESEKLELHDPEEEFTTEHHFDLSVDKNPENQDEHREDTPPLTNDDIELTVMADKLEEQLTKNLMPDTEYDPTLDLSNYQYPPLELLEEHSSGSQKVTAEELEGIKTRLSRHYAIIK